jgi:hypothetical protein
MTREQYEARKLRLDEERQAAMEMVWMSFSGEPVATSSPAPAPPPPPPAPVPVSAAPQKPPRPKPDQIYADVTAALPRLPERFDRNDICKAIGYEPDRVALYRILNELVREGQLQVLARGLGKKGTKYRRA